MNRWLKKIKRRPEKFLIILIFSAMVVITISAMRDAYNNRPSSVEYYDSPIIGVNFIIALLSIGAIVFFFNFYYSWRKRKEKDMWDWWNKVVK